MENIKRRNSVEEKLENVKCQNLMSNITKTGRRQNLENIKCQNLATAKNGAATKIENAKLDGDKIR